MYNYYLTVAIIKLVGGFKEDPREPCHTCIVDPVCRNECKIRIGYVNKIDEEEKQFKKFLLERSKK